MGYVYIHRSAVIDHGEFFDPGSLFYNTDADVARISRGVIESDADFDDIMMIWCNDFDGEDEPVITRTQHVTPEYEAGAWYFIRTQAIKEASQKNPLIYHHKWQFVNPDYKGFDVDESVRRSKAWLSLPGLDMRKIGRYKYWSEEVVPKIPDY